MEKIIGASVNTTLRYLIWKTNFKKNVFDRQRKYILANNFIFLEHSKDIDPQSSTLPEQYIKNKIVTAHITFK